MSAPRAPRLGVVVPTLDEEEALPALLQRLVGADVAEADRADEVVVVDGGSRDRTAELALESGARVVESERGRGRQLAAGARALDAELLLFLHADNLPAPGALASVRRAFDRPEVVATGMRQRVDAEGRVYRGIEGCANYRVRRLGIVYGDSGLCVRRSAYERSGGFADLPIFEDVDLSRRIRGEGEVVLVEGAELLISARRWKASGVLRCTARNWILTLAYLMGVSPHRLARLYRARRSDREPASSP